MVSATMERTFRRRVAVIFNPIAGGGRKRLRLQRTIAKLTLMGCDVTLRATGRRGDAERIAGGIRKDDFDALAVAGGDGTIQEVANGLGPGAPPLALIPLGTANVLAAEIGLPARSTPAAETIARGVARPLFCGRLDGRRFVLMAGAGFDAAVVHGLNPGLKRAIGKGAYMAESLRQMLSYPFPVLSLRIDGEPLAAASVLVLNGRRYAGPYTCAPEGDLWRPGFQVVLFEASGVLAVARYGAALLADRLPRARGVEIRAARLVEVEGPAGAPIQVDGDAAARAPARITPDPQPIDLLLPPPVP